jgi:hypothetical protein
MVKHYRDTAEEVRERARHVQSEDIRDELFDLAERYDRLAIHVERRQRCVPRLTLVCGYR